MKYTVSDACTFEELLGFIKEVESDFYPPLFRRIDVSAFISKVLEHATINTCRLNDDLIGAILFYANDLIKREAYITFLAVKNSWRGFHIASRLLQTASEEAKSKGMTKICVSTCNSMVVRFYRKYGFIEYMEGLDTHAESIRFFLVKEI